MIRLTDEEIEGQRSAHSGLLMSSRLYYHSFIHTSPLAVKARLYYLQCETVLIERCVLCEKSLQHRKNAARLRLVLQ